MMGPAKIEEAYKLFSSDLSRYIPDGIIHVDIHVLNELGLLDHEHLEHTCPECVTQYFHVIESPEKVTLFNEQFVIWIVPCQEEKEAGTLTYLSIVQNDELHLELVFSTTGVYNTPKYILNILQKFISEVVDNEKIISSISEDCS